MDRREMLIDRKDMRDLDVDGEGVREGVREAGEQ
jgi:hypothetical protein